MCCKSTRKGGDDIGRIKYKFSRWWGRQRGWGRWYTNFRIWGNVSEPLCCKQAGESGEDIGRMRYNFPDEGTKGGEDEIQSFLNLGNCVLPLWFRKTPYLPPKLDARCACDAPEELDSESDDTTRTKLSDTLSKASGATSATLPIPHPVHTAHHIYYYSHH